MSTAAATTAATGRQVRAHWTDDDGGSLVRHLLRRTRAEARQVVGETVAGSSHLVRLRVVIAPMEA